MKARQVPAHKGRSAAQAAPPRRPAPLPKQAAAAPAAIAARLAVRLPGDHGQRLLAYAVLISIVVHGLALSIQFTMPDANAFKSEKGLEVILVNARHRKAPEKAEALAQSNMDGGGNSGKQRRPTTPLPPQQRDQSGDALIEARRRLDQLEQRTQALLTQSKKPAPAVSQQHEQRDTPAPPTERSGADLLDSAAAIARLEAQIDKDIQEYAARPRKAVIGPRTKEYRFAQYVEAWRQKIERIGTLNYPASARGRIYGSLLLSVQIRADGSLERADILRSSGHRVLDEAALSIVRLAAPYADFPPDISRDTDIIEITRTWSFTQADEIQAK